MTQELNPCEVTQEDRDAVQAFHREMGARLLADIKNGTKTLYANGDDSDPIYQAFARHRQSAQTSQPECLADDVEPWTVRVTDEISEMGGPVREVLLPNGEWRGVIAVDAEDARDTIRDEWLAEQADADKLKPPPEYAAMPLASRGVDREAAVKAIHAAIPLPGSERQLNGTYAEGLFEASRIVAALAQPLPTVRGDDWQDIATAPKDGTWIWAFWPISAPEDQQRVTQWLDDADESCWMDSAQHVDWCQPTHWKPLPTPPADGDEV